MFLAATFFVNRISPYSFSQGVRICLSVCLSVTSQGSIEADERIELILARELPFDLSYTVLEGNSGISKNIDLYLCRL